MKISSKPLHVSESKIFSYPTRFADTWFPAKVLEIMSYEEFIGEKSIELVPTEGDTGSLSFQILRSSTLVNKSLKVQTRRKIKKTYETLRRKFSGSILHTKDEYLFDTRTDFSWTDKNVAHILCNVAPVVLGFRAMDVNVRLIVREKISSFAAEFYRLLGFSLLSTNKNVEGTILAGATDRENMIFWRIGCFGDGFENLNIEKYHEDTPDRIFISRRGKRRLLNEAEIENLLNVYGFKKVYFEDLSVSEQWSLARNATVVVAVHGAAIANLAFNRNQVTLIELFNPGYQTRLYRRCMSAIDGRWCGVLGKLPDNLIREIDIKKNQKTFAKTDLVIHPDSLIAALDYMDIHP